jgi:hypothetical protein
MMAKVSWIRGETLKWPIRVLLACIAALVLVIIACLVDANFLRGVLTRYASSRTGRSIRIDGNLTAHLISLSPRLTAERVSVGNPPWMPPGPTAEIGTLSFSVELLPLLSGSLALNRLDLGGSTFHLVRTVDGRANWQAHPPGAAIGHGPPLIHSLSVPNARVELHDDRRHLDFEGTVSAGDKQGNQDSLPFEIKGTGQLNGKPVTFTIDSDSLVTVRRKQPYHFEFSEESTGSHLTGRGLLTQPLDIRYLSTTFDAEGADLKDLYYLIGVSFPDTGPYHLSGKLERQGLQFKYSDLLARSGQSDVHGTLSVDSTSGRSKFEADLYSQRLRMSDLGASAAGRAEPRSEKRFMLPEKPLRLAGIRRSDGTVTFEAREFDAGRIVLRSFNAKLTTDNGVLEVPALAATLPDGKLTGRLKLDASFEVPKAELDLRVTDLQLSQLSHKGTTPPRVEGLLQARVVLSGRGRSIHELAETSNGTVTAVLPHGAVRATFAELTGIDLTKALGLALRKDNGEVAIRCGVASFQVHDGAAASQELMIDTEPVRITGKGDIHLNSEALDFTVSGKPKKPRLVRVQAPVLIRGTLEHPTIGIEPGKSLVQAGAAVAIGVLASPFAAILAFVDPGLAKDADCATLIAETDNAQAAAAPAAVR